MKSLMTEFVRKAAMRHFVGVTGFFLVFARMANPDLNFDATSTAIFLFSSVVLLTRDIGDLIARVRRIKAPGVEVELDGRIEKLAVETENVAAEAEEKMNTKISNSKRSQALAERAFDSAHNPIIALDEATTEISRTLRELAKKVNAIEGSVTLSHAKMVDHLVNSEALSREVQSPVLEFLDLATQAIRNQWNVPSQQVSKITELGLQILNLLTATSPIAIHEYVVTKPENPTGVVNAEMSAMKVESVDENVYLYTTVFVVDEERNVFPAERLSKDNFSITERNGRTRKSVEILSAEPIVDSRTPLKVVLAIDGSHSMEGLSGIGGSKIERVKEAAKFLIGNLRDKSMGLTDSKTAVLRFGGDEVSMRDFSLSESGEIWSTDFDSTVEAIDRILIYGNTPLWDAIDTALEICSGENGYTVIVCLTDGQSNRGSKEFKDVARKSKDLNIPIFTLGYGTAKDYFQSLVELSKSSNAGAAGIGSFVGVKSSELAKIFDDIGDTLVNAYRVYWKSPGLERRQQLDLDIEVRYQDFTLKKRQSYVSK